MGRLTIKQVAELAGVSPAAVSRYLNGGPLAQEKRERIQKTIEETGYQPSIAGQMLRTGKLHQIAVIVPRISSSAVGRVTMGISEVLREHKYMMLLCNCDGQQEMELEYLRAMQENHVAGMILMATGFTPAHREAFDSCKLPLVITGQKIQRLPCVYHDDRNAARELGERMLRRGCRHLAYIGVGESDPAVGLERRRGVEDAMRAAGLEAEKLPRYIGEFSAGSGAEGISSLLEQHPEIDGLICATDLIALGAMTRLRELGRSVPEEIALAGFGDSWAGCITTPTLSTVHLYQRRCGMEAARMLLDLVEQGDDAPIRQIRLGYRIEERESL